MQELSEPAKRMLEALKAEETPSKTSADRMWAAVAATGATATAAAALSKGKLLWLGALGIASGVALWIIVMPPAPERTPVASDPDSRTAEVSREPVPASAPLPTSPAASRAPTMAEPVTVPESVPVPRAAPKKSEVKAKAIVSEAEDLERELALLSEAKAALGRDDPDGALTRLARHRNDFPRSSFAPERDFLRMTALCRLGRREQARRMAAEFLERHPGSALRPRVEQVCRDE